ncbi:flagellin-like hook-associated protein FlgL [Lysinibacillus composti]|uniref:Flagellin n=1 Tax=Lysinibacillus composti TaxID=720633 RepID=A0A3N9UJ17_9BACI|nr:flagellin [Lysinibacillus composti]MBM7607966.1 flagellin-like hook-associated protein FlgL [Lysinibacillus composti]RQW75428.1 hypothetical protein EBB45_06690 [Lysinibacillus composti]
MRIKHNITALNTLHKLNKNIKQLESSMKKLSFGMQINSAADDAAGLAISEKMRAQIRGLETANKNIQDGISLIQIAEGALSSMNDITQRMRELTIQGGNGTLSDTDLNSIQLEINYLKEELSSIAGTATFNKIELLNGDIAHKNIKDQTLKRETITIPINLEFHNVDIVRLVDVNIKGRPYLFEFKKTDNTSLDLRVIEDSKKSILKTEFHIPNEIEPTIQWQQNLGSDGYDGGIDIIQLTDGSYMTVGQSGDSERVYGYLAKLDQNGQLLWEKEYPQYYATNNIVEAQDGNFIISGFATNGELTSDGMNKDNDVYLSKIDTSGNVMWERTFDYKDSDSSARLSSTSDGGFIMTGHSRNHQISSDEDAWILKLDANGDVEWKKNFNSSKNEILFEVQETVEGGYLAVGYTYSSDGTVPVNQVNMDAWIIKLDSDGNTEWEKTIAGTKSDMFSGLVTTEDGGFIVSGSSASSDSDFTENYGLDDMWVIKFDNHGIKQWSTHLGGSGSEQAFGILKMDDGGFIIVGPTTSTDGDIGENNGDYDAAVIKISAVGEVEWKKIIGGSNEEWVVSGLDQTLDGGFVMIGRTESSDGDITNETEGPADIWITKFSADGYFNKEEVFNLNYETNNGRLRLEDATIKFSGQPLTINEIKLNLATIETEYIQESVGIKIQSGANSGQSHEILIENMHPNQHFSIGFPSVESEENVEKSINMIDAAISKIISNRVRLGAYQNRLEHTLNNNEIYRESLTSTESTIRDTNMAKEIMVQTKNSILVQASQAMLAQANQEPQSVLQLLG